MNEYIAKFGHGSAKLARQAQSKEKTLEKMVQEGLTEKVDTESVVRIQFERQTFKQACSMRMVSRQQAKVLHELGTLLHRTHAHAAHANKYTHVWHNRASLNAPTV
jgi:hypothetical protein